jgi:DNA-binding transcriptional LysR family regulator
MPSIDRIGRRLKLNDLHVFLAVVQAGSMGKAAERLNTSQSAVSRTIADLEHVFGVRLLDRSRSGIEPTKYGSELMKCGTAVFDDLRQGVRNIEFLTDPTVGEVRIGTTEPLSVGIVAATIDRLSRRHPRMRFTSLSAMRSCSTTSSRNAGSMSWCVGCSVSLPPST